MGTNRMPGISRTLRSNASGLRPGSPYRGDVMNVRWGTRAVAALGLCGLAGTGIVATTTVAGARGDSEHVKEHHAKKHAKQHHAKKHAKQTAGAMAGMDMSSAKTDDKGLGLLSNGHHAVMSSEQAVTPEDRTNLSRQITATIATAQRFPTVADALAAGYKRTGPYMPGIGAHYIHLTGQGLNPDGVMDESDLADPLAIVYAGTDPTSPITGFMYYSMSPKEPAGFAGGNDVWHYHASLCLKYTPEGIDVPYGLDRSATKKQCESVGGSLMTQTQWMVHVWSVPGWESRQGLFGEVNPALMCPDGSYYQLPPSKWHLHPLNACKSAA